MNNPSPVPFVDFVANLVNNLGNISLSIPWPVSFILTVTCWPSPVFFFSAVMYTLPPPPPPPPPPSTLPSLANFTALFRILERT